MSQKVRYVNGQACLAVFGCHYRVRESFPELATCGLQRQWRIRHDQAASQRLDQECAAVLEALTGIKRAGADLIITYHAKSGPLAGSLIEVLHNVLPSFSDLVFSK